MNLEEHLFPNLPYDNSRASLPVPYREISRKATGYIQGNWLPIASVGLAVAGFLL